MADPNDDLLEDGDLNEANFVLDLAEEEALLADVDDDIYRGIEGNLLDDDDDYVDMGIGDDLVISDDEILENEKLKLNKRRTIKIERNDDSDDNSGGERIRFKSERQIISTSSTRNTSAIPDTLDAVAVRNPIKINKKGGNRGGGKGGRGGGQNWKGGRNHPNIHVNPHFRPRLPMGGPHMWNGGFQGGPPQPPFQPQRHPLHQPPHHPSHYPPHHPSHYPPHLPPHHPPHLPPHHQPPYGGFPPQPPQWNDQGFYNNMPPHGPPQYNQPPMDDNFYEPHENYQNQPNFHPPPHPAQPQMGWGDEFYQGSPLNYQPPQFQPGPGPQMGPPRMRPPFNQPQLRPPFNKNMNNKPFIGKPQQMIPPNNPNWGGMVNPQKREQFQNQLNAPPVKQQKFEHRSLSRNLEEVTMLHAAPPKKVLLPISPAKAAPRCLPPAKVAPRSVPPAKAVASSPPEKAVPSLSTEPVVKSEPIIIEVEDDNEDEEMKTYRQKIEEQKKLREKILKAKEEKRLVAAQQKTPQVSIRSELRARLGVKVDEQDVNPLTTVQVIKTTVPVVKTPVPVAKTPVPVAKTPVPVAKTPVPAVKKPVPVAKKPVPVVKTPVPVVKPPVVMRPANKPLPVAKTAAMIRKVNVKTVPTNAKSNDPNDMKFKMAKVRNARKNAIVKKVTLVEIKTKVTPAPIVMRATLPIAGGTPSCVISVDNLSASTTQKQLETMASAIGPIEKKGELRMWWMEKYFILCKNGSESEPKWTEIISIVCEIFARKVDLDAEKKTAIIKFIDIESAKSFLAKYQRKMLDLSMIGVKYVKQN